jgi:subtilisin family serine protease
LQRCDDTAHRHYTDAFSGTSSASPIVAGAAVLLESYAKRTLSPAEVRTMLATGSPQTGNTREHIGPRPDLAKILSAIETPATRSR